MVKNEFYYPSVDGKTQIHAVEWIPNGDVVGVLQIAHGVTEYILRYEEFANYFTSKGFVVVGNDHLGHGDSVAEGAMPMYFGPKGSWNYVVEDFKSCRDIISKRYNDVPYFLLGFSLGSFVVRSFLIQYPNVIDGAIIMGTGQQSSIAIQIAKFVANKEGSKYGEDHPTPTIKELTFGNYNKNFSPNRTDLDWLCSSEKNLDIYIADPKRGEEFSAGLFRELLDGMLYTAKLNNIKKMNTNIPILFISGGDDPVGEGGKGVIRAYRFFKKAGIKDVSMKLYPGLRHDILHEDCNKDIYNYLYEWLISKIDNRK